MKQRPKRKDAFFGMHFDFHARRDQANIGQRLDEAALEELMSRVRPDFVQCDTKGHSGNTSYPTCVGYPAPEMKGDILRLWREVTARHGVSLYAHHSGVWDDRALEHHPEWADVNEKGEPDTQKTSVFGPYVDELLIPQLKEMALDYGLDGAWIDGECWAVMMDYSRYALEAWKKKTGKDSVGEEDKAKYLEFNRQGFRDYVRHYIDEVHKAAPDFEIASNWMYTSYTPEKRDVPVDYISGDYSPSDSTLVSRMEARCTMGQDRPWDLMAWGFTIEGGYHAPKELNQLKQEAATVISLGGGFQIYNQQMVDSVQTWQIPMWEKLAAFCRQRQDLCFRAKPVPQAAVLFSVEDFYDNDSVMFPYHNDRYKDMRSNAGFLLDNQISTEIKKTHQLENMAECGLWVVPNCRTLEAKTVADLKEYVINGGSLIVSGPDAAEYFNDIADFILDPVKKDAPLYVKTGERLSAFRTDWTAIRTEAGDVVAVGYDNHDDRGEAYPLAVAFHVGRGYLVVSSVALGDSYTTQKSAGLRDYMALLVKASGFMPRFTVSGSHLVEAMLMEKDGTIRLNLTNLAGAHEDRRYRGVDEIPPLGPLAITIQSDVRPERVMHMPEGEPLDFNWENGIISFTLDRLLIHSVIEIVK